MAGMQGGGERSPNRGNSSRLGAPHEGNGGRRKRYFISAHGGRQRDKKYGLPTQPLDSEKEGDWRVSDRTTQRNLQALEPSARKLHVHELQALQVVQFFSEFVNR
jgi:hypothetical protein